MERIEKLGTAKRFGARYGSKPKHKFAKIEKEQRKKHKCPYCNAIKVKRVSAGIWNCKRCNAKFTGKAYSVSKAIAFEKEGSEEKEAIAGEAMEEDEAVEQIEQKEVA
ncbi:50S ribosomal protein L37ae [Candidatus Woesearchaeota archaeon]|nr:50S ribosomal protein L37ae [Candidatus Woesearchaeota archaeon]